MTGSSTLLIWQNRLWLSSSAVIIVHEYLCWLSQWLIDASSYLPTRRTFLEVCAGRNLFRAPPQVLVQPPVWKDIPKGMSAFHRLLSCTWHWILSICMIKKLQSGVSIIFILRLLLDCSKSDTGQWSQHMLYKKYQNMRHPDRYGRWQVNDLVNLVQPAPSHFHFDGSKLWLIALRLGPAFRVSRKHHRSGCEVPATEG
jgi:hypothetical protein